MAKKRTTVSKIAGKALASRKTANTKKKQTDTLDVKAKERVEKLLEDVDNVVAPEAENSGLLVLDESANKNNIEWLQEQMDKLTQENEKLHEEAKVAQENYKKIYDSRSMNSDSGVSEDPELKKLIVELFVDIQNNFKGNNPERRPYKQIIPVPFMVKMIKMFPFLEEYRNF